MRKYASVVYDHDDDYDDDDERFKWKWKKHATKDYVSVIKKTKT